MQYAPIAVFVYNRADHAKSTIEALAKCPEATNSDLYVFSDGAKNESGKAKVDAVREYLREVSGQNYFKSVKITESEKNKGLAASIIEGVSRVLEIHGKIIVVEDDCIASPHFLKFMNACLDQYENDKQIGSIAGYAPPIQFENDYAHDIFLAYRSCSWGWATWKNRWDGIDWKLQNFSQFCSQPDNIKRLNCNGNDRFIRLYRQTKGDGSSWSVRFGAHHALNNWLVVYPKYSYISNIGCDESGVHSQKKDEAKIRVNLNNSIAEPNIEKPQLDARIQKELYRFYSGGLLSRVKRSFANRFILVRKNR